jgi:hypothetical protein
MQQSTIHVMTDEKAFVGFPTISLSLGIVLLARNSYLVLIHNMYLMKHASGHLPPLAKAQEECFHL